ncbi:MAG: hypothetical protein IPG58_17445 [Acidobacteria bacterium]|nr:hypothetical protein [Acidobacteriota bacterium]
MSYQVDSAPAHSTYGGPGYMSSSLRLMRVVQDGTFSGQIIICSATITTVRRDAAEESGECGRTWNFGRRHADGDRYGCWRGILLSSLQLSSPWRSSGFEADVAPRPNGDGNMLSTDITQMRRFVSGTRHAKSYDERGSADRLCSRSTFGDGIINSSDVVQGRRYVSGLDVLTPAGGQANRGGSVPESIFIPNRDSGLDPFQRELSIGEPEFRRSTVIVPIGDDIPKATRSR